MAKNDYFLSGYVTLRGEKKVGILWTGNGAQHLVDEHMKDPVTHPFLHLAAQKQLQRATIIRTKSRGYFGLVELSAGTFIIPFDYKANLKAALPKTCHILIRGTMEKAKKHLALGAKPTREWHEEGVRKLVEDGYFGSVEEAKRLLKQMLKKSPKLKAIADALP